MSHQNWLRKRNVVFQSASVTPPQSPSCASGNFVAKALGVIWRVFKYVMIMFGLSTFILTAFAIWTVGQFTQKAPPSLPSSMILSFNLDGELSDASSLSEILSYLQGEAAPLTIDDVTQSIERATTDNRVQALVLRVNVAGYNLTQLQRLRASVINFKQSGKKTIIFSESYGAGGVGLGVYYLASAFDEIWLQPVGSVSIGGLNMQVPFFKGIMDDYGVEAQFFQREEYKNAMEHLTSKAMSPASRESMQSLVDDLAKQMIEPIKAERQKIAPTFDAVMDLGLLTDKAALKVGLVDRLDYEDVLVSELEKKFDKAEIISMQRYTSIYKRKHIEHRLLTKGQKKVSVAVIPVDGMIISGSLKKSPYGFGDNFAYADDIVAAIEDAALSSSVNTIVLRVNSPGGSPTASETIHRAIIWARQDKKKRVVISMSDMAASGGYWIAAAGDKIFAMDSTLTGSIGVVGGKINLAGTWKKFNVNWDSVSYGQNSVMMSMNSPFSESERRQFEASLDSIYDYFIQRVAEGRKLKPEQVKQIAKGRAYTGRQAKALGLVDEIGGMDKVLDEIAKANKLKSREELNVVYLPGIESPMQILMTMMSEQSMLSPIFGTIIETIFPIQKIIMLNGAGHVYNPALDNDFLVKRF